MMEALGEAEAPSMPEEIMYPGLMNKAFKSLKMLALFSPCLWASEAGAASTAAATDNVAALSYSDIADLANSSPLIVKVRVSGRKAVYLGGAEGAGERISYVMVNAKAVALIRGAEAIPPQLTFLVRAPAKGKGAVPSPLTWRNGQVVLLFARPAGTPGQIQLVSRNAAQPWSEELEAAARAITTELLAANAAPAIRGVGDAFHVAGTVEGESETQIFLKTENGAPVSLSVVHRPGEPARWGVSLGEIVDETAVAPAPGTLLWYRLACSLPETLPDISVRTLPVLDAEAARRDYRFVLESLGSCGRTL